MSKKIKDEQKKFLGETLNQYDKALDEAINQLDKKNREQNHKISSLVNSFDNEYLEKDVEGNMTTLENSKDGMVIINEIQGSTEVNYCKDGEKELILNGDIDTQGESFVTITEGVDGGLVDVSLEGNTEINLSKTKDPVLVTREFDDINCNVGKLQYTIDDVTTINDEPGKVDIDRIVGDTMVNHAVNGSEELILNAHINESGDNNITLNGVTSDGGKVDVALEGNTLVNVSKTKDDYITPTIEDKVDQGSVISLPEVSEGLIHIDEIEGNTLVNYCTDGSKELTLNGDIDVEGTFVTTTEGVDNGLVDVALEGNTLVNLMYEGVNIGGNNNIYYVNASSAILNNFASRIKTSTTYTIIIYNAPEEVCRVFLGGCISELEVKPNVFILNTGEDKVSVDPFHFYTSDGEIPSDILSGIKIVILEGDYTDKEIPPYFEGMKSVGQDDVNGHKVEIVSRNKNEINLVEYTRSFTNRLFGSYNARLPVMGKTFSYRYDYEIISISEEQDDFITNLAGTHLNNPNTFTDFDLTIVNQRLYNGAKGTVVVNNISNSVAHTLKDIRGIRTRTPVSMTYKITNFALYFSDNADTYIPYTENKKEILLNEPLRKLSDEVKDRFVKIGSKWYIERNTKEVVLDGSYDWETNSNGAIYYNTTRFSGTEYVLPTVNSKIGNIVCDKRIVTYIDYMYNNSVIGYIGISKDGNIGISSDNKTPEQIKSELTSNPIRVILQLKAPTYELLEIEPTLNTYNDTTHISNDSIIPCNMKIQNTGYNAIIKPSTLYTVALDTNANGEIGINLGGAKVTTTNNVATITTPSTLTDDSLRLYGKGIKGSRVRLLEGDKTNWIPSYFEGMKSSFEDKVQADGSYKMEILMSNKNLIDYNQAIRNNGSVHYEIDRNNSNIVAYSMESSPWQNVQVGLNLSNGKTYTLSYETLEYQSTNGVDVDINYYVAIYETIPNREIAHINYATKNTTFTVPKDVNAKDLGLRIHITQRTSDMATIKVNGLMVTESNQKLDFAPPISNKIQFSSIEPLRGVGDVHDRLVFKDGKLMIERNFSTFTLNSKQNYYLSSGGWENKTDVCTFEGYIPTPTPILDNLIKHYADTVPSLAFHQQWEGSGSKGIEGISTHAQGGFVLSIKRSKLKTQDVDGLDEYLRENPITVVYQLAEPTYEEIPYDLQKIILESYNNGTLFIDTNIPPTKVSFNCFEEELTYLYPATSYTLQFVSDRNTTADISLGGTQLLAQSIVKGLNRISITTPSELVDSKLIINGTGAKISEVVVTNTDREFGYFEGMKSVGECEELEVTANNKNLWNWDDMYNQYGTTNPNVYKEFNGTLTKINDNEYSITPYQGNWYEQSIFSTPVYLKKGESLTFSGECSHFANICIYNLSNFLSPCSSVINNPDETLDDFIRFTVSCTAQEDGYYVCRFWIWNNKTAICRNIQVEKSSQATDYIPHQSNKQQLTHEPLRAVGDVKDRYVLIDGKWYIERNCGGNTITINKNSVGGNLSYTFSYPHNGQSASSASNTDGKTLIVDNFYGARSLAVADYSSNGNRNTIYFHYTNMDVVPDYAQDILKFRDFIDGKTINLVFILKTPYYEPINYNPLEVYSGTTHISVNSTIPCKVTVKNHGYNLVALKENTQYTLYVNKDTTNALTYRLGDYVEINSLSKFTFTTPSTLTDKTLRIDSKGAKVKDLMLIEGTPTNDSIGYFDGLKSSYECEQVIDENDENYGKYKVDIKVVGKNLFDTTTYLYMTNNVILNDNSSGRLDFARNRGATQGRIIFKYMKAGTYYFSTLAEKMPNTCNLRFELWQKDKEGNFSTYDKLYEWYMPSKIGVKIVLPKNGYICLATDYSGDNLILSNIQLVEGDTATEYEPYFESKQTVYLNSPLLKGDEIVWKDNKIQHYHKMNKVVLDGSDDEEWRRQPELDNDTTERYWIEKINNDQLLDVKINTISYNDKFDNIAKNNTCLYTHPTSARVDLRRLKTDNRWTDLNSLKQWLQDNPVTVVYQLTTPYYEEISDYPLKLNAIANSSLSTESTIQVTNISFNIYEETLPYLYPNTKYYITFNTDVDRNNIIIDLGGNHVVFDCKVGFNKVEITTPSDTTNLLTFSGTGVNINHVKVTQQDIDEYFEGMKSVGECEELEITSANSDNTLLNTQTLTHEPLRAVGNVKDRYVLIDGKWYIERNCREITIKDTILSTFKVKDTTKTYTTRFVLDRKLFPNILVQSSNSFKSDRFKYASWDSDIEGFGMGGNLDLNILNTRLSSLDVKGLAEWFKVNPTKFIYILKEPIYEEINYNPFETYSDTTHITTNSLIPSNMVIKNHGYNCILKPSTKYTIVLNKPNGTISAKLGGSTKVDSTNSIFTITTPSTLNDNVLRLSGSGNVKDIMILEGDKTINTPSYFEGIESGFEQEYDAEVGKYRVTAKVEGDGKESNITFYINEPLRGVENNKDKVFIQDGKVIVERNCGHYIFNENTPWIGSDHVNRGHWIRVNDNNIPNYKPNLNPILSIPSISSPMGYPYWQNKDNEIEIFWDWSGTHMYIFLHSAKTKWDVKVDYGVDDISNYMKNNPIEMVYELAEPTYEEVDCDLSKLVLENYENSSLIFESNIPVSANIRYSGEVPVVTQAKALSSQVDNTTLDINENIIPYMCDIDYRIVELQLMNGDTQGEDIELLGIGDIEILGNENVLFNNREDKKHNFSYDMLKRDILSQRYSKEEYRYRLDRYLLANKISDEEYKELEGLLNNGE